MVSDIELESIYLLIKYCLSIKWESKYFLVTLLPLISPFLSKIFYNNKVSFKSSILEILSKNVNFFFFIIGVV